MPSWVADLLLIAGLIILAVALLGGTQLFSFPWYDSYVNIRIDRTSMLWVGGAMLVIGGFSLITRSKQ